jgi:thioredoxin-dependent peroxiredoxin
MLAPGTTAPEFTLPDHTNTPRSLQELRTDAALILYFYPADFTPGCTKEACDLRDLHADIMRAGLRVVGVSPQDPETHTKFREKYDLPFVLLSDVDRKVIRLYDVDGPLGLIVRRGTYLIGKDGKIIDAVLADLRISKHEEFVRKAIAAR